jgi:hypothetical protein
MTEKPFIHIPNEAQAPRLTTCSALQRARAIAGHLA